MCVGNECGPDRREFLAGGAALAGLAAGVAAQDKMPRGPRAVDDPAIVLNKVEFKCGADTVDGYLARPKQAAGPLRPVVVVPGSWLVEPYIPETTAMLAQAGYAALAVNVLHYFPKVATYAETDKVPFETTQALIRKEYSDDRVVRDLRAGADHLLAQKGVRAGGFGLVGFCGGGWQALLAAARLKGVSAVVPFYAPVALKLPGRLTPMDVVKDIAAPVQGHYGTKDAGIPLAEVRQFEAALKARGTPVEVFTYDAGHGFFAFNRDEAHNPTAAAEAWKRTLAHLDRHLPK